MKKKGFGTAAEDEERMSVLERQRYLFKKEQKKTKSREFEVKSKLDDFRAMLKQSKKGEKEGDKKHAWLKGKLEFQIDSEKAFKE